MTPVWRSKWLDWQSGDQIISVPAETELTKLPKNNSVNSVSTDPGENKIISAPEDDPAAMPAARATTKSAAPAATYEFGYDPSGQPRMLPGVKLILNALKPPPVRLSRYSTVVDVEKFISTTLMQLDARLNDKHWQSGNWTASDLLARLEACGVVVELDDPRRARQ